MDKLELKNIAVEQGLDFDGVIELVFDAQQAKVEELQTLYTQQGINMLKMQKRVDAVIIEIENMYLSGAIGFDTVKKLEQALKGRGND